MKKNETSFLFRPLKPLGPETKTEKLLSNLTAWLVNTGILVLLIVACYTIFGRLYSGISLYESLLVESMVPQTAKVIEDVGIIFVLLGMFGKAFQLLCRLDQKKDCQ